MFVDFNILNQLGSPAINSNTFANRPAAGQTGRLFVSTDTFEIYRDNGTTWDLIGGPGSSTITGTGTATQVAYFTSSQAIGSSANLFWNNTNGFLGVATATPSARIEAVKTDGVGIYANYTTNAGSGSSTTALWAKNVTNGSGFSAVIEETTPNTTAGQYPLLIKHSLSSGTAGVGMGTGIHWQLPDDAGTFKTTQLTIETTDAAAATYKTRYRFNVQNNGSSLPVAYINSTGLGIFTATPGAALDIHSTGTIAQLNSTSATANSLLAFQRSGSGLWRIGDVYNGGPNYFELYNTVLGINAMQVFAATNKTSWQATENYTTGLARGNYFDYNLSVSAGGSFSSPNAITALGASLDLTLAGSATIPSGARSGLDAYNSISFTGAGTLTHNQGSQIRAYSNLTAGWAFNGSATGTVTHLAGLRALFPDNTGSAINVTNNYALLLNDQTPNTGTVTYTNRWGVYQEGASDLNYMAANLLLGSTTNSGEKLQVIGYGKFWDSTQGLTIGAFTGGAGFGAIYAATVTPSNINHSFAASSGATILNVATGGIIDLEINTASALYIDTNKNIGIGTIAPTSIVDVLGGVTSTSDWGNVNITSRNAINAANRIYTALRMKDGVASDAAGIGYSYNGTGYDLEFATVPTIGGALTENMRVTSAGLVGIGTNAPAYTLEVNGNTAFALNNTGLLSTFGANNSTDKYIRIRNSSSNIELGTNATEHYLYGGSGTIPLSFYTNATFAARITSGQNFLIGTTTDSGQKLQVNGDFYLKGGSGSSTFILYQNYSGGGVGFTMKNTSGNATIDLNGQAGNIDISGGVQTGAPTGGTAARWKLGSRVAAAVVLDATQYIEVDIGGTLYKLAIVT